MKNETLPPVPDFVTAHLLEITAQGVSGIRKARNAAAQAARAFAVELEAHWRRPTEYLVAKLTNDTDPRTRERSKSCARYALAWRPKFLASLSVSMSPLIACRAARIDKGTAYQHRAQDPDFAAQWAEALADAVELLHTRAYQRSVEGDLEPITYQGQVVGYVRKFDSRLQIEMLRAHVPDKFKTAGVSVNIGARGDVFVLTEEQRHELQRINRQWLEAHGAGRRPALHEQGDSTAPPPPAPSASEPPA